MKENEEIIWFTCSIMSFSIFAWILCFSANSSFRARSSSSLLWTSFLSISTKCIWCSFFFRSNSSCCFCHFCFSWNKHFVLAISIYVFYHISWILAYYNSSIYQSNLLLLSYKQFDQSSYLILYQNYDLFSYFHQ